MQDHTVLPVTFIGVDEPVGAIVINDNRILRLLEEGCLLTMGAVVHVTGNPKRVLQVTLSPQPAVQVTDTTAHEESFHLREPRELSGLSIGLTTKKELPPGV